MTVTDLFVRHATVTPDAVAVVDGNASLCYGEIHFWARRLAAELHSAGAQFETPIGLYADHSIGMIAGMLGILSAGCAYVPLTPDLPRHRLEQIISDAGLRIVLSTLTAPQWLAQMATILPMGDAPGPCADHISLVPPVTQRPDQLAYVLYTSGTTGKPKGVMIEHRNVVALLNGFEQIAPSRKPLAGTMLVPFSFDVSVWEVFSMLCYGGTLHLVHHPELVTEMARYLVDHQITSAYVPPALLDNLADELAQSRSAIALDRMLVGVEPILQRTLQRFRDLIPGLRIVNGYGPTETTVCATFYSFTRAAAPNQRTPIGTAVPGYRVYVVDSYQQPVPAGGTGEILIGGAGVGRGYLNAPALTQERFIADPFSGLPGEHLYLSGDFGRLLSDGNIEYVGRIDEQVKIRGFRVELGEIENAVLSFPGIEAAALDSPVDPSGARQLVIHVVWDRQARADIDGLRAFLADRLPGYMQPAFILPIDRIPRNINGKVDRDRLPKPDWAQRPSGLPLIGPRNTLEAELVALFTDVLSIKEVGVADDFFALGGNSLAAGRLLAQFQKRYGQTIGFSAFFESPTVEHLARLLTAGGCETDRATTEPPGKLPDDIQRIPLSPGQQRLWFVSQLEPDNPAYNVSFGLRLKGDLNIPALLGSVNAIVARHAILRTRFHAEAGEPYQEIADTLEIKLPVIDFTQFPSEQRESKARLQMQVEVQRPFRLDTAPLIRTILHQLDQGDHILQVTLHHIVFDGWSSGIFLRELSHLYTAAVTGQPVALPSLSIQYADFTCWQRADANLGRDRRQIDFWKQELAGPLPETLLPTDRPRPATPIRHGATEIWRLDHPLWAAVQSFSRHAGATVFMTLLAGFETLLYRLTGEKDLLIGTIFADRRRPETDNLIGFLINNLALRVRLSGETSFEDGVALVRGVVASAFDNSDVPIEKVLESLRLERDPSRRSLFSIVFNLVNVPCDPVCSLPGLAARDFDFDWGTAIYDLYVEIWKRDDELVFKFEYNTDLYDATSIRRLIAQYQILLDAAVAYPRRTLDDLPILTPQEQHAMLVEWNQTQSVYPSEKTIHALFEEQAARTPHAIAVVMKNDRLTYAELNLRAERLAARLRCLGIGPEQLVGVCIPRSPMTIVALLGVLKAGGGYLPLDPAYPEEQLDFILADAQASALITVSSLKARFAACGKPIVCLDDESATISTDGAEAEGSGVQAGNLAYVIYTSGSTGRPKGVMIEHRSLVNYAWAARAMYELRHTDRVLQFASINFDASVEEIFPCLIAGATLVLRTDTMIDSTGAFLRGCRDQGITVVSLPTAFWHELVRRIETDSAPLPPDLRLVILGGERVQPERVSAWFRRVDSRVKLVNTYGPTETTVIVTAAQLAPEDLASHPGHEVAIGRPIANTQVYVLDSHRQPVPVGTPGELYVGGDCLARGYLRRPELTAQRFVPDPFSNQPGRRLYRTGDLVKYRPDGCLEYLGRNDDQVKMRGYRVELGEIETAILEQPGVQSAAVAVKIDQAGEPRLVAYLVYGDSKLHDPNRVSDQLKHRLPKFMVPDAFVTLAALPLTPSNKVDRAALPSPDWSPRAKPASSMSPRSPVEERLVHIWSQVLGLPDVGVHDSFFDLGGHSLLAARLMARIEDEFSVSVPLATLFEAPTIAQLASRLQTELPVPHWPSLAPLQPHGAQPPLYLVHPIGGDLVHYHALVECMNEPDQPVYGLRSRGLDGASPTVDRVEAMAANYIEEIRSLQPGGPYYLAGHSFGGLVAYEMAQQLHALGERVGLLALFEPGLLFALSGDLKRTQSQLLMNRLQRYRIYLSHLIRLPWQEKGAYLHKVRTHFGEIADARAIGELPSPYAKVWEANMTALWYYRIKPYPGRATLFMCEERERSHFIDPVPIWLKLALGGLEVINVPGNHMTLIEEPNSRSLGPRLVECLCRARNDGASVCQPS